MRALLAALALVGSALPATAQSDLGPADLGRAFCAALVAGDMSPLAPLLTTDLGKHVADTQTRWSSGTDATACMPVGATGTRDHPESVLFLTFADGTSASDRLILSFVDGQLRIDDIAFATGGTLRQQ